MLVTVEEDPAGLHAALQYLPIVKTQLAETHPRLIVDTDVRIGEAGCERSLVASLASSCNSATYQSCSCDRVP